jgi:hypothetical protein
MIMESLVALTVLSGSPDYAARGCNYPSARYCRELVSGQMSCGGGGVEVQGCSAANRRGTCSIGQYRIRYYSGYPRDPAAACREAGGSYQPG